MVQYGSNTLKGQNSIGFALRTIENQWTLYSEIEESNQQTLPISMSIWFSEKYSEKYISYTQYRRCVLPHEKNSYPETL